MLKNNRLESNDRYWVIDMQKTSSHPFGTWIDGLGFAGDKHEAMIDGPVVVVRTMETLNEE